jgi:hypothetical protein
LPLVNIVASSPSICAGFTTGLLYQPHRR